MNAGKIAEATGLDRKVVDKAMAELKKEEPNMPNPLQLHMPKQLV